MERGQEDRRTGGQEDGRTGGQKDRRTGGQEDGRTGGQEDGRVMAGVGVCLSGLDSGLLRASAVWSGVQGSAGMFSDV
jgi:hypothetical protein